MIKEMHLIFPLLANVRFPYKDSNIPSKMFHSTIGAEVICRATSAYDSIIKCCEPFIFRMSNQGANKRSIQNVVSKFINRHLWNSHH